MSRKGQKSRTQYRFIGLQLRQTIETAVTTAEPAAAEICGLLIDNGFFLEILPTKNKAKRPGSFQLPWRKVKQVRRAAPHIGHRLVGTFHSHPVSPAVPGESDIRYAEDGSLMLVISCWDKEARLWHIRKGKAKEVAFVGIEA